MILNCPNCATRYLVDPASIGEDGRYVRCANCSHEWFEQAPPQRSTYDLTEEEVLGDEPEVTADEPEAESEEQEEEQRPAPPPMPDFPALEGMDDDPFEKTYRTNVPAVVDGAKLPGALIGTFCAALVLAALVAGTVYHRSVMKYLPFTKHSYAIVGLYPTRGLMLTDVTLTRETTSKTPIYKVDCKIINVTRTEQFTPGMLVSLLDKDGAIITEQKESSNEGKPIDPGERISCDQIKVELNERSKNAAKLRLDIGNAYDLFIR